MEYTIDIVSNLSGEACGIYTLCEKGEQKSLFNLFLEQNFIAYKSEIIDIVKRLSTIGHKTGAREQYFKLDEGKPGDGICALYDEDESKLRLYCIRFGRDIIILGGGGEKPKNIRAFQENEKLTKENYLLREASRILSEKIESKEIKFSSDGIRFEGDLVLNIENHD